MSERHINTAGIELIRRFEHFEPRIYEDAVGIPTIGYGHLVKNGVPFEQPWTEAQATQVLQIDARVAEWGVLKWVKVDLTDNQFAALVSFVFNLGSGCLQRSTLRARLNRGDYDVQDEFLKYCFAGGRKLRGLLLRRKAEALLFGSEDIISSEVPQE